MSLDNRLIEKIFQTMEDRYGTLWAARYGAMPRERVKRTWAEDLADVTPAELADGLRRCRDVKFPPTLPEFRELCRISNDHEAAYWHAVTQMANRDRGVDQWASPAVFWAAVRMWPELRSQPYAAIKRRWAATLDSVAAEIQAGTLQASIPPRREPLPAPVVVPMTRDAAKARLAELRRQCAARS